MDVLNTFAYFFWEVPPVTRTYITASFLTTLALRLDFITPFQLYFNPTLIFSQYQYWRLVTSFLYFGQLSFHCLFNMLFTFRYCRMLEEEFYRNRTADFFYLFLIGGTLMNISALFVNLLFLGQAFSIMIVYIWSRRNPSVRMNFFGMMTFQAPYLPWVLLTLTIMLGSSTVIDIMGIIVGHFYYFFEDVFPYEPHGFRILETPRFIKRIFIALGIDEQQFVEEERPEQFNFAREPNNNDPTDVDQGTATTNTTTTTTNIPSEQRSEITSHMSTPTTQVSQTSHVGATTSSSTPDQTSDSAMVVDEMIPSKPKGDNLGDQGLRARNVTDTSSSNTNRDEQSNT